MKTSIQDGLINELKTSMHQPNVPNSLDTDTLDGFSGLIFQPDSEATYDEELQELESHFAVETATNNIQQVFGTAKSFNQVEQETKCYPGAPSYQGVQRRNSWCESTNYIAKEKERKYSHNLVERRRRFKINDKIKELETLLPVASPFCSVPRNKGSILTATVDYIRQIHKDQHRLHQIEQRQQTLEHKLERIIAILQEIKRGGTESLKNTSQATKRSHTLKDKYILQGFIPIYSAQRNHEEPAIEEIFSSFIISSPDRADEENSAH